MRCEECKCTLDAPAERAYELVGKQEDMPALCTECMTEYTRLFLRMMEAAGLAFCSDNEERTLN